jgi:predicted unusual protein kinase regulating ubiquinone biosynthesis (AarF/ABC1/UbiB family)
MPDRRRPGKGGQPADEAGDPGARHLDTSRARRGANLAKLSASTGAGYLGARVRGLRSEEAEQRFHEETARKLLEVLGSMKGAAMKLGQLASFVDLDLPPEVQAVYHDVLGTLRSAAPAVDPERMAGVVEEQFGAPPERVFGRWDDEPLASASIGQVHSAALPDGTEVAVKVQYPGVAEAVESDLANAEAFAPMARLALPNLRIKPLLEELRLRIADELDYQREAAYQQAFAERYADHPFIHVPRVHADWCRPRVLTSDRVRGLDFEAFVEQADEAERQRAAEILYRFTFGSLHRFRLFHGDPHPGNYLFPADDRGVWDGSVVFLDFGSVKAFSSEARDRIERQGRAVMAGDAAALLDALAEAGFTKPGQEVDAERLLAWFRMFNAPMIEDREFTYTSDFAREVNRSTSDPRAGWFDLLRKLNMPPDYLLLNRIQLGVNSILGRLRATANWHRISLELMGERAPATALGEEEASFLAASPFRA